ncbi:Ig-like domain-containing protein [Marinilabilia rubra]|nr:Ig-like domain-containing protein [Marinilabilia rubra]
MRKYLLKLGLIGVFLFSITNAFAQPSVTGYDPIQGATGVPVDKTLTLTFDEDIQFNSRGTYYVDIKYSTDRGEMFFDYFAINDGVPDPGLSINSNQLIINSPLTLNNDQKYYVLIQGGAIQNTLNEDYPGITSTTEWSFTAEAPPNPPIISALSPTDNATNVSLTNDLVVTFNENIVRGSGNMTIYNSDDSDFETIPASSTSKLTISNNQLIIDHSDFALSSGYYILMDAGFVKSESSDADFGGISSTDTWNFETESTFAFSSLSPSDDATDAILPQDLVITFPENIARGTGTMTIYNGDDSDFESFISSSTKLRIIGNQLRISHTDLVQGNDYYVQVPTGFVESAATGNDFEGITDAATWNFSTSNLNIWSGDSGTDWATSGNWGTGAFDSNYNVLIPAGSTNDPTITSSDNISLNDLYLEPGATLTQTGGSLSVSGTFTLASGTDINASYLPLGGTLPATIRAEQEISNAAASDNYFIASPVTGATKGAAGITDAIVYYDNPSNSYIYLNNDADVITNGRGHVTRNPSDIAFIGSPQAANTTINVERNADGGLGWNLVGNPFTASIDWSQITLTDVENSFWLWLNESGIYGTYNGFTGIGTVIELQDNGGIIPSNHSFWVKVNENDPDGAGSLDIPLSAMTINQNSYLKSTASSTKYPSLKLASNLNGQKDEFAVALVPEATAGNDKFDTEKKVSGSTVAVEIFTLVNNSKMAINGLPFDEEQLEIPVGFFSAATGKCQLSLSLNTLSEDQGVMLFDRSNGQYTDLSGGASYEFDVTSEGYVKDRFSLIISKATATSNEDINEPIEKTWFYSNKSEIIAYIGKLIEPRFKLVDINGRLLKSGRLNPQSRNTITVDQKGMVVLIVESAEGTNTFKTVF